MSDPHTRGRLPSPDEAEQLFRTVAASAPPSGGGPPVRDLLRAVSRRGRAASALGGVLLVLVAGARVTTQVFGNGAPPASGTSAPARAAAPPGRAGGVRGVGLSVCLASRPVLTTDAVDVVACDSERARFLVRESVELAQGPWPGTAGAHEQADGLCRDLFDNESVRSRPPADAYPPVVPSEAQWAAGDRLAFCLLPL